MVSLLNRIISEHKHSHLLTLTQPCFAGPLCHKVFSLHHCQSAYKNKWRHRHCKPFSVSKEGWLMRSQEGEWENTILASSEKKTKKKTKRTLVFAGDVRACSGCGGHCYARLKAYRSAPAGQRWHR